MICYVKFFVNSNSHNKAWQYLQKNKTVVIHPLLKIAVSKTRLTA